MKRQQAARDPQRWLGEKDGREFVLEGYCRGGGVSPTGPQRSEADMGTGGVAQFGGLRGDGVVVIPLT